MRPKWRVVADRIHVFDEQGRMTVLTTADEIVAEATRMLDRVELSAGMAREAKKEANVAKAAERKAFQELGMTKTALETIVGRAKALDESVLSGMYLVPKDAIEDSTFACDVEIGEELHQEQGNDNE